MTPRPAKILQSTTKRGVVRHITPAPLEGPDTSIGIRTQMCEGCGAAKIQLERTAWQPPGSSLAWIREAQTPGRLAPTRVAPPWGPLVRVAP